MQYDWKNIDTVLLDMDGTLLDLHFDNYFWLEHIPAVWAQNNGLELKDARSTIFALMKEHAGTLNWYCVDFWSHSLKLDIMELKAEVSHKIGYRPLAEEFLKRCRKECNDVRMVTNAHRKILDLKISKTGIDQYFDELLCSHELDLPKENPEFWVRLNQKKSFNPQRTLFLDDNERVLESAETHGIKHLYSIAAPDSVQQRKARSRFHMLVDLI